MKGIAAALATTPRAMDKVIGLTDNDTGSQVASRGQKEKDRSTSDFSGDSDNNEE